MKKNTVHVLFLILLLLPAGVMGQVAEKNSGNNWVHPGAMKFIGMDFLNSTTGTLINNGTVWYCGNFRNNGTVDFTPTLATTTALSQFAGDALQHIAGSGFTRFYSLMFGSQLTPTAYNLEQDITVVHQVDFSKGILTTLQTTPETMMNRLLLENGATCINASDNSYVDGFVSKIGNSAFTFPIGNGGFYRPVAIGATEAVTNCLAARYLHVNPDMAGYTRQKKATTLARISDTEYWVINRTNGSDSVQLTLSWDVLKTSAQIPNSLHTLAVARWDGSAWVNEGNIATTGDRSAGTITANVHGYGVFTLAAIVTKPPVAVNDSVITYENTPATGNVLANDSTFNGATLVLSDFSIAGITYQTGTTATIVNVGTIKIGADGVFTYSPLANYNGLLPVVTYTITDSNENTDSGTLKIQVLPLPELIKTSGKPVMNNEGIFSWIYTFTVQNDTPNTIENIQVEDNLDDVFNSKGCTYAVTKLLATGGLTANGLYDGSSNVKALIDGLSLSPNQLDSIILEVRVNTHGQTDSVSVFNQATLKAKATFGEFSMKSHNQKNTVLANPTKTSIPGINLVVIDGFSPNGDGINDKFVITHPTSSKIEIEVFNRSGNSVYKSGDYKNDWDGTGTGNFLGRELIDGTYYMSYKETKISTGEVLHQGVKFITIRR